MSAGSFLSLFNIDCLMKEKQLALPPTQFRSHFEIHVIQYACCRHFIKNTEIAPKEDVYNVVVHSNGILYILYSYRSPSQK